jgi:hypothetical protein
MRLRPRPNLQRVNDAVGLDNRLCILVLTCLAEVHLGLGDLEEARILHCAALDARLLELNANLVLRLVDRLGTDVEDASQPQLIGEALTVAQRPRDQGPRTRPAGPRCLTLRLHPD